MTSVEVFVGKQDIPQYEVKLDHIMTIADALVDLGNPKPVVRVLLCLHIHGPLSSKELQSNCQLRQPEISNAVNQLDEHSFIEIQKSPNKGRGRPHHIYRLCKPIDECVQHFMRETELRIQRMSKKLEDLRLLSQDL
ncbi:MAG TPA: MarR family transcriptional regulator [Candidatus Poseidoniaceae archaeon]|nr:MAG TPA: MarR family transcriptional regulator [Candidatus Poseidoniales archaeon]HII11261.1 MarR family transcriptional regulator [Candidatus Poseidoniaceae archaeon]|tara:strand:+ start:74 stop:484 length:411 start_codon:yes stop_codon:yes gene_type:complete